MTATQTICLALAAIGLVACAPPGPPTVQQSCAAAVATQTGMSADEVEVTGTVNTAIGPKIYTSVNGSTYTCQADKNNLITSVDFQS
ncbi:hypothetical protein [Frigidibacter sp. ROC022]|uniref:hypothetical protein n=1 Tax=Frigidibacter sp. ROC022 TaxID=2971796 RepID=UPI00215A5B28|nr:hypothetical protein [Frigidibacter sp. ROC022]MCR8725369.1 hypothetical protein [Frigidibacter sp. ROC022]